MKEFTLDYIKCLNCNSKLELEVLKKQKEIEEGFLHCTKCESVFPIIEKLPIIWDDFSSYISNRRSLGGKLANSVSPKMKLFLKKSLTNNIKNIEDRSNLEKRWTKIYQESTRSKFYSTIKKKLGELPASKLSLEYGCSIGIISKYISESSQTVFGIDRSFTALKIAQKNPQENLDYLVADSLSPVFGKTKFDLVLALNLLELVEPRDFLNLINGQIKNGRLLITDPYDYDRGKNSVKQTLDEKTLRKDLKKFGFKIILGTEKPSNLTWNLKLNPRTELHYKVDLVIAQK